MDSHHRLRLLFVLALVTVFAAAAVLWVYGPRIAEHLSTPTPAARPTADSGGGAVVNPPPPVWSGGGAALVWVAVGIVLATGLAFVAARWYRPHS